MALLVTDQGEIDSLRTLLNATHTIPRNLVLKLYTSNNDPLEADVPTNSDYFEPYDASNASGYGSEPVTGYPEVKNNRTEEDQDFSEQYGILLNGNRWTIGTTVTAQATASATGSSISKGNCRNRSRPNDANSVTLSSTSLELSTLLNIPLTKPIFMV